MDVFQKFGEEHKIDLQLKALREYEKTLRILASKSTVQKRARIPFQTQYDCLKFISNYSYRDQESDDITLVSAFHDLITQHVLHWMPAKYQSELCPHQTDCLCIPKSREQFVLNILGDLGVDTVKMKPLIDAAYILSLERKLEEKPQVKRVSAFKSSVVWRSLQRASRMNQQSARMRARVIYQEIQRPVIVEYIPCSTPIAGQRLSPPFL